MLRRGGDDDDDDGGGDGIGGGDGGVLDGGFGADPDLDDEDELKRAIRNLREAWINEKAAPEVLPYAEAEVALLLEKMAIQEEASHEGATSSVANAFLHAVYMMEISRLRFLLNAYLRTRLHKIEQHALYFATHEAERDARLSPAEQAYVRSFRDLVAGHFDASFLGRLNRACISGLAWGPGGPGAWTHRPRRGGHSEFTATG
jgi:GINS complex subunit 4